MNSLLCYHGHSRTFTIQIYMKVVYEMNKAIETIYNGFRFRSRLEARWAVFFDNLSVKYRYEPEGFDLCQKSTTLGLCCE